MPLDLPVSPCSSLTKQKKKPPPIALGAACAAPLAFACQGRVARHSAQTCILPALVRETIAVKHDADFEVDTNRCGEGHKPATASCSSALPRPLALSSSSHFASNFDVKTVLGKGAYGVVYRCTNRVDFRDYAVKIVKIPRASHEQAKAFEEVKTFARLSQHPNVLRYYNSWIEPHAATDAAIVSLLNGHAASFPCRTPIPFSGSPSRGPEVAAQRNQRREILVSQNGSHCSSPVLSHASQPPSINLLFIQMECPQMTLKSYLEGLSEPLSLNGALEIWTQIVMAVAFVHESGYVHRDISSANIFVNALPNGAHDVKLGDFGLAVPAGAKCKKSVSKISDAASHGERGCRRRRAMSACVGQSSQVARSMAGVIAVANRDAAAAAAVAAGVIPATPRQASHALHSKSGPTIGTPGYSPPELSQCRRGSLRRRASSPEALVSPAIDVFSLSVVLLELLSLFNTRMERAHLLMRWNKLGSLPAMLEAKNPAECEILLRCGCHDPNARPEARQVVDWCMARLAALKHASSTATPAPGSSSALSAVPQASSSRADMSAMAAKGSNVCDTASNSNCGEFTSRLESSAISADMLTPVAQTAVFFGIPASARCTHVCIKPQTIPCASCDEASALLGLRTPTSCETIVASDTSSSNCMLFSAIKSPPLPPLPSSRQTASLCSSSCNFVDINRAAVQPDGICASFVGLCHKNDAHSSDDSHQSYSSEECSETNSEEEQSPEIESDSSNDEDRAMEFGHYASEEDEDEEDYAPSFSSFSHGVTKSSQSSALDGAACADSIEVVFSPPPASNLIRASEDELLADSPALIPNFASKHNKLSITTRRRRNAGEDLVE